MRIRPLTVLIALFALTALTGCGFKPLYAESSPTAAYLDGIRVELGQGRAAYLMGLALEERLPDPGPQPRYELKTEVLTSRFSTALTIDDVAARIRMTATTTYALYDLRTGLKLTDGLANGDSTFDVPPDPYAATRADQDATERAVELSADTLISKLVRYFSEAERLEAERSARLGAPAAAGAGDSAPSSGL